MIAIRPATQEDSTYIIDFQQKMALETENVILDPVVVAEGLRRLFEDSAKGIYYVAEENNEVIGCMILLLNGVNGSAAMCCGYSRCTSRPLIGAGGCLKKCMNTFGVWLLLARGIRAFGYTLIKPTRPRKKCMKNWA